MNRVWLIVLCFCAGLIGFLLLRGHAEATRIVTEMTAQQCGVAQDSLVQAKQRLAALRSEVVEKRNRLHEATRGRKISPELVSLLEGDVSDAKPAVRAELRERLEAGWDASPDYVLVRKEVLKDLNFQRLVSAARVSDVARDILALTSAEEAAINSTTKRVGSGKTLRVERSDPAGDVVAQYTALPLESALEQQLSNTFSTEITGILGPERSPLLVPQAWREIRTDLAPREPETLIVRRSVVDGEPDLTWEEYDGSRLLGSSPVRYAHYPSGWFLAQFPGGWKTLADREGFELPQRFKAQQGK